MSAVPKYGVGVPQDPNYIQPWETTPWWHIARWFGYSLRRYYDHPFSGGWDYERPHRAARAELEKRYGGQTNVSGTGPWRQGTPDWHRPNILR